MLIFFFFSGAQKVAKFLQWVDPGQQVEWRGAQSVKDDVTGERGGNLTYEYIKGDYKETAALKLLRR